MQAAEVWWMPLWAPLACWVEATMDRLHIDAFIRALALVLTRDHLDGLTVRGSVRGAMLANVYTTAISHALLAVKCEGVGRNAYPDVRRLVEAAPVAGITVAKVLRMEQVLFRNMGGGTLRPTPLSMIEEALVTHPDLLLLRKNAGAVGRASLLSPVSARLPSTIVAAAALLLAEGLRTKWASAVQLQHWVALHPLWDMSPTARWTDAVTVATAVSALPPGILTVPRRRGRGASRPFPLHTLLTKLTEMLLAPAPPDGPHGGPTALV